MSYQKAKVGRHAASFSSPDERFTLVHVDITGPLPVYEVQSYLLICEALPMKDITAYSTAKTFVAGWVSRFGVPAVIITDRGKQFESNLFNPLMKLLVNRRIKTTAYHLELVELFHHLLKSAVRAWMNQSSWPKHLPLAIVGLRTAIKEDTKCSFAEMVYGTILRLPEQFFLWLPQKLLNMTSFVDRITAKVTNLVYNSPARSQKTIYVPELLQTCAHAFVQDLAKFNTLQPAYRGPFKIPQRYETFYEVEIKITIGHCCGQVETNYLV